jgi:hypothetical protein
MQTPHVGSVVHMKGLDSLVWSGCEMLASRGERDKRGEMADRMSPYPPLIQHDVT